MFVISDQCFKHSRHLQQLVELEHDRQIEKWGTQTATPFRWFTWLTEEVGELAEAIEEHNSRDGSASDVVKEAIQTATLALKIAEMYHWLDEAKDDPNWPWQNDPRPILCLDFDGVLHSYMTKWTGPAVIPDPPVKGAIPWLKRLLREDGPFRVCIYSSRSKYGEGVEAMKLWLEENGLDVDEVESIGFPTQKPPAFLTVDDRAYRFSGVFPDEKDLQMFVPWNRENPERA